MKKQTEIKWCAEPEDHNFPAAESYLSLIYDRETVAKIINSLRKEVVTNFKAKDIFRASQLSLLGVSNSHVEKDRKKIANGKELSPILLVRDKEKGKLIIADGYHRLCAIYSLDEDALIPCKII
jgi:hypothetical protein